MGLDKKKSAEIRTERLKQLVTPDLQKITPSKLQLPIVQCFSSQSDADIENLAMICEQQRCPRNEHNKTWSGVIKPLFIES